MIDDDDGLNAARTEINQLKSPYTEPCQWDRGCSAPTTHNVCQYDPYTIEGLVDGVDANFCEPHARTMGARLS